MTLTYDERCLLYTGLVSHTGLGRDETKTSGACSSPRRPRSCFAAHAQRVQFASSSPTRRLWVVLACHCTTSNLGPYSGATAPAAGHCYDAAYTNNEAVARAIDASRYHCSWLRCMMAATL